MYKYSRLKSSQSKKYTSHQKIRKYLIFGAIFVGTLIVLVSFSKISYLDSLNIKNIRVTGTKTAIENSIRDKITQKLQGAYLGMFSRANTFLYSPNDLVANLQSSIPSIKSLNIHRNGLSGLQVDVVEKTRIAKICPFLPEFSEDHTLIETDSCYYVDWSGQIFDKEEDKTIDQSDDTLNLYFIPNLIESIPTGETLLSKYATSTNEFMAIQNFYNGVKKSGLNPKYILFKENGEYEMFVNEVVIYFNNLQSLEKQLDNLISFWQNSKINAQNGKRFEYVDLRFGSNVFYRPIQQDI